MNNPVVLWRKTKIMHTLLGQKGKLLVWTKIYSAPEGFEQNGPYFVGLVKFKSGKVLPLQIVDCDEQSLRVGLPVIAIIRRLGDVGKEEVISYGIKVKPYENN